jgi:hypothetical protein
MGAIEESTIAIVASVRGRYSSTDVMGMLGEAV